MRRFLELNVCGTIKIITNFLGDSENNSEHNFYLALEFLLYIFIKKYVKFTTIKYFTNFLGNSKINFYLKLR